MIEIKIYEPGYDKKEFYGIMGDPLTMPKIKKEVPFLSNSPNMIWFQVWSEETLVGFGALKPWKSFVDIKNLYVYPEYRGNGITRILIDTMLDYSKKFDLPLTIAISINAKKRIHKSCQNLGFYETRRTKNYIFLRRDKHD